MSALCIACTIAGIVVVVVGGVAVAVRLLRGNAVSHDESGARRLPNALDGQTQPLKRPRATGGLAGDVFARADDGSLWRWDGTRWVEHIEDLPTPKLGKKGNKT